MSNVKTAHRVLPLLIMALIAGFFGSVTLSTVVAPEPAHAGTNLGLVRNISGAPIMAYCDYGHPGVKLYEKIGPYNPWSSGYGKPCGLDTDQVGVWQARCVHITSMGIPRPGYFLLTPNARYKVSGTEMWDVYARTTGKATTNSKNCTKQASGRGA